MKLKVALRRAGSQREVQLAEPAARPALTQHIREVHAIDLNRRYDINARRS